MLVYVVSHRTSGSALDPDSQAFLPTTTCGKPVAQRYWKNPEVLEQDLTQSEARGFLKYKTSKGKKTKNVCGNDAVNIGHTISKTATAIDITMLQSAEAISTQYMLCSTM